MVSNVAAVGGGAASVMMTMRAMNVFVLISVRVILTKTIPIFFEEEARYAFLFKLDITDYKGWARGLKKAGYATDPSYANRLITIIEDYDLYKYDRKGVYSERKLRKNPWADESSSGIYCQ